MGLNILIKKHLTVDVYSWGIMFWECLTRKFPYYNVRLIEDAQNMEEARNMNHHRLMWEKVQNDWSPAKIQNIPNIIQQLLDVCWKPNPDDRYKMPEIVRILDQIEIVCKARFCKWKL